MKKVKTRWLVKLQKEEYNSLEELMKANEFVGFENMGKYIMTSVSGIYYAIYPPGFYNDHQNITDGEYFIFDTAKELFNWALTD